MGKARRNPTWKTSPIKEPTRKLKSTDSKYNLVKCASDIKGILQALSDMGTPLKRRILLLTTLNDMINKEKEFLKRYLLRQDLFTLGMDKALNCCRISSRDLSATHPLKEEILRFEEAAKMDDFHDYNPGPSAKSPIDTFVQAYFIAKSKGCEAILMDFLESFESVSCGRDWKISISPRPSLIDPLSETTMKPIKKGPLRVPSNRDNALSNAMRVDENGNNREQRDEKLEQRKRMSAVLNDLLLENKAPMPAVVRRPRSISRNRTRKPSEIAIAINNKASDKVDSNVLVDQVSANIAQQEIAPLSITAPPPPPPPPTPTLHGAQTGWKVANKVVPPPAPPPPPGSLLLRTPIKINLKGNDETDLAKLSTFSSPMPPPPPPLPPLFSPMPPPPPPPPSFFSSQQSPNGFSPASVTKSAELWEKPKKTTTLALERIEHHAILNEATIWNDCNNMNSDFSNEEREELLALFPQNDPPMRRKSQIFDSPVAKLMTPRRVATPKAESSPPILSNDRCLAIRVALRPFYQGKSKDASGVYENFYKIATGQADSGISSDVLENLLKVWPTDEELENLRKTEEGDIKVEPVVKYFCLQVARDKQIRLQCRLQLLKERSNNELAEYRSMVDHRLTGIKETIRGEMISEMLHKCLRYANYINQGSALAGSAGLALSSLEKTLRAPNRTNGMAKTLAKHSKFCSTQIESTIKVLEEIRKVDLNEMKRLVKSFAGDLLLGKKELKDLSNEALRDEFLPSLEIAEQQIKSIEEEFTNISEEERNAIKYFCAEKIKIEGVMDELIKGLSLWAAAAKDLEKTRKPVISPNPV